MGISSQMVENTGYRVLPREADELCERASAPPRLMAHLVLVHDAACILIEKLDAAFPGLVYSRELVRFGAATHDIGKSIDTNELLESGHQHQAHGMALLESFGVTRERARFAFTHGNWDQPGNDSLEDLLVALADKCWRGKRNEKLEATLAERLSFSLGETPGSCYAKLNEILASFAPDTEAKLAWQGGFPAPEKR